MAGKCPLLDRTVSLVATSDLQLRRSLEPAVATLIKAVGYVGVQDVMMTLPENAKNVLEAAHEACNTGTQYKAR